MTNTYNTGNPLGSTDARDLYDNASNMDEGMNSGTPSFTDRLGVLRKTWNGLESEFDLAQAGRETEFQQFLTDSGFTSLGNYAAGLNFTLYNQYMARDGFFYRPAPSSIPFTTTGTWVGGDENLFSLFSADDVLRQDLANDTDPAKGAGLVGYKDRTVSSRLNDVVSVKDFGAVGDGVADDSAAVQDAINSSASRRLYFPLGVYLCSTLTIPHSMILEGDGAGSVLKQAAATNATFVQPTVAGIDVSIVSISLDQNNSNQTYGLGKFLFNCEVGDVDLKFKSCVLKDFCEGAIRIRGDKLESTRDRLTIVDCKFRGGTASQSGVYNTFTVFAADGAELIVDGCDFDHGLAVIDQGISAIAIAGVDTTTASYTKVHIVNNKFDGYGRFTDGSGIGVIDAYAWAEDVIISNNLFMRSYVTPIRGKINARNVTVIGNQLSSFVDIGSAYGGGIHLVSATLEPVAGRYIISGNSITNCPYRGIEISSSTDAPQNIIIKGNIVDTPGDIGIYINKAKSFIVSDNIVKSSGQQGIAFANCEGLCRISGNIVNTSAGTGIGSVGAQAGLSVEISSNEIFASTATGIFCEDVDFLSLANNLVRNVVDGGGLGQRAFRVGGAVGVVSAQVKGNTALGTYLNGFFQITSAGVASLYEYGNSWNRKEVWLAAAPTTGSWLRGDVAWNTAPAASGFVGFVCVTTGTPGTWKGFGIIQA